MIIRPQTVPFEINSQPDSGAHVSYGGTETTTPYARQSGIGYQTSVAAEETYTRLGRAWLFDRWSDGGARLHNITIPAAASALTAFYRDERPRTARRTPPAAGPASVRSSPTT